MLFFGKFCVYTKRMTPYMSVLPLSLSSCCFREQKDLQIFENSPNDYHKVCIYIFLRIAWTRIELTVFLLDSVKSSESVREPVQLIFVLLRVKNCEIYILLYQYIFICFINDLFNGLYEHKSGITGFELTFRNWHLKKIQKELALLVRK